MYMYSIHVHAVNAVHVDSAAATHQSASSPRLPTPYCKAPSAACQIIGHMPPTAAIKIHSNSEHAISSWYIAERFATPCHRAVSDVHFAHHSSHCACGGSTSCCLSTYATASA